MHQTYWSGVKELGIENDVSGLQVTLSVVYRRREAVVSLAFSTPDSQHREGTYYL
jgi:hypothetical protein